MKMSNISITYYAVLINLSIHLFTMFKVFLQDIERQKLTIQSELEKHNICSPIPHKENHSEINSLKSRLSEQQQRCGHLEAALLEQQQQSERILASK